MDKKLVDKELLKLSKKEASYLNKHLEKNFSNFEDWINEKTPDKIQDTLHSTISKAFGTIFVKGTPLIEKSYNKSNLDFSNKMNVYALEIAPNKKNLKKFSKQAKGTSNKNVIVSGTKSIGLGALGIGMPDIPVFIYMILKGIYEISATYGYDYELDYKRYFILQIIKVVFSYNDQKLDNIEQLNDFVYLNIMPVEYSEQDKIDEISLLIANDLIYSKFIQGIPIVGVVGGALDLAFTKLVLDYANIKYQQRFLYNLTKKS